MVSSRRKPLEISVFVKFSQSKKESISRRQLALHVSTFCVFCSIILFQDASRVTCNYCVCYCNLKYMYNMCSLELDGHVVL